ncbi:hypothetical protein WQE_48843 [Paraburkholderia hospita]|uniref:Uncharacterized protein n=1 Tax=Paraburkholderia hospita TaxID=169430 RepID=A0ABN0F4M0_9BURK|nr:hypothetical protein [Paraburkholderia hospita]EIM93585.1 hypothetical protein WQE_48843 [Paraburkholderia hospita]
MSLFVASSTGAPTRTIARDAASRLVKTGAIHTAHVVGYKRGWRVLLTYDMTELPVATRRGKARVFKRHKTIVSCLRDMGIVRFDVDAHRCDASAESLTISRSNAGERLCAESHASDRPL